MKKIAIATTLAFMVNNPLYLPEPKSTKKIPRKGFKKNLRLQIKPGKKN